MAARSRICRRPTLPSKSATSRWIVIRAGPAQTPLRIAILVSDAGTGGFQQGLGNFMQKLLGHAEFSLISVIVQPDVVVDYASEGALLRDGLRRLGPRGRNAARSYGSHPGRGAHGPRATAGARHPGAAGRQRSEHYRCPGTVREQLRKSGALLHVVSTLGAQRRPRVERAPGHLHGAGADGGRRHRHRLAEPRRRCSAMAPRTRAAVTTRWSRRRSCRRWSGWPTSC